MKYIKLNEKFVKWENGEIGHRPWFKIVLNPILRCAQFWTDTPLVITSICVIDKNNEMDCKLLGYEITAYKYKKEKYD